MKIYLAAVACASAVSSATSTIASVDRPSTASNPNANGVTNLRPTATLGDAAAFNANVNVNATHYQLPLSALSTHHHGASHSESESIPVDLDLDLDADSIANVTSSNRRQLFFWNKAAEGVAKKAAESMAAAAKANALFEPGSFRKKVASVLKPQSKNRDNVAVPRQILEGRDAQYLTRDAKRYNDLKWGFEGYDNSYDDHTCEPIKHFVYLKTHKTGSSTLCNMVHRFVMKHNLSAALPWSNQFYAWPSLKAHDIVRATERRAPLVGPFDLLGSAHVRYAKDAFEQLLVPEALENTFTVLRSPVSHFKSSWSYWGVASHIRGNGGPSLDWETFILDPETYWQYLRPGDIDLIWNNMLFDFGAYKVCVCVCVCVVVYVCVCVCMYVCMYVCVHMLLLWPCFGHACVG